ncbi:hypothetical protein HMPREF1990_00585 [Porphyromonas gingivalis W4087]|nr:hypothetical protein HMPREF1990_00585 [Porphyromonas gingivalis W4087]
MGHCLHPTLEVKGCLSALHQAFDFHRQRRIDTTFFSTRHRLFTFGKFLYS